MMKCEMRDARCPASSVPNDTAMRLLWLKTSYNALVFALTRPTSFLIHNFHSEGRPRSASKWKLPSQIPSAQSFSEQFQRPCTHIVPTSCPWPIFWPVSVSSLFGITVVQVYTYYHNFPKDWKFQKYAVCLYNPGHISTTPILTLRSQVALLLYLSKVYSILCLTLHRLLDISHAVFTNVAIYHYLIDEFGDIGAVQYLSWYEPNQGVEWL